MLLFILCDITWSFIFMFYGSSSKVFTWTRLLVEHTWMSRSFELSKFNFEAIGKRITLLIYVCCWLAYFNITSDNNSWHLSCFPFKILNLLVLSKLCSSPFFSYSSVYLLYLDFSLLPWISTKYSQNLDLIDLIS